MDISQVIDRFDFVPSFLDLEIENISMEKLKYVYSKTEDTEDYDGECSNINLTSFLSLILEGLQKSSEHNTIALERSPRNIQANVMKTILLFSRGEISEAERSLEHVKLLSEDEFLIAESKAEIAYAYSKIDASCYKQAITIYEEILPKYPDKFVWKYRLALSIRRTMQPALVEIWPQEIRWDKYNLAKNLFEDIVARCPLPEIKSLSYIGLATLICGPCASKEFLLKRGFHGNQSVKATLAYLDKANEACDDKEKILTETGRLLRSMKQNAAAITILKRSYAIKKTSINCHHLGLALQRMDTESSSSMGYLEEAVALSDGLNLYSVFDLGKLYLSNFLLDKACECFEVLIDGPTYQNKADGYEYLSKCYEAMQRERVSAEKKREHFNKAKNCQRESIINAMLYYLKGTPINKREKISPEQLFTAKNTRYNYYSRYDQAMRVVCYYQQSLEHYDAIQKILRSVDIHKEFKGLMMRLFRDKMYKDCLDMLPILMFTSIEDIEKFAVDISLDIVENVGNSANFGRHTGTMNRSAEESLLKTCFKRMKDCLFSDELDSDIRLIYTEKICQKEVDAIEELLSNVGMTVKKNDEGILPFTNRMKSLSSILSSTIAVICIFKENNIDLLNEYPIDTLSHEKPIILSMAIDNSSITPILQTRESISFPDFAKGHYSKGSWLKEFGQKIFYPALDN